MFSDLGTAITALATLVAAVTAGLIAFSNNRKVQRAADAAAEAKQVALESATKIIATADGVYEIGKKLDGRLEELLKATAAASRAEGVAAGEQSQRDRQAVPIEGLQASAIEQTAENTAKIADNTDPDKG